MKIGTPAGTRSLVHFRAGLLDCVPKESRLLNRTTNGPRRPGLNKLALTFGTLLSSQGTDAHPPGPLGRSGGNPINVTRSGARCQNRPSRPIRSRFLGPGRRQAIRSALRVRRVCDLLGVGPRADLEPILRSAPCPVPRGQGPSYGGMTCGANPLVSPVRRRIDAGQPTRHRDPVAGLRETRSGDADHTVGGSVQRAVSRPARHRQRHAFHVGAPDTGRAAGRPARARDRGRRSGCC